MNNAQRALFIGHLKVFLEELGEFASNVVIEQLVKSKSFPVLTDWRPVLCVRKYQYKSINYVISSTFRKIFNTRS